jgi:hypothetical protein
MFITLPFAPALTLTRSLFFSIINRKLLEVNIFTYVLAALIIFVLGANAAFGPGWLGQNLGWEDVGTFTKMSDSLPLNVDVSGPNYLL